MADYLEMLSGTKPRVDLFGLTPEQINQVSRTNLATEDQGFSAAGLITKAIEDRVNKGLKERQLKEQERSNAAGETHAVATLKAEQMWREMQNALGLGQLGESTRHNIATELSTGRGLDISKMTAEEAMRHNIASEGATLRGQDVTKGYYDTLAEQGRNSNIIASRNAAVNERQATVEEAKNQLKLDEAKRVQDAIIELSKSGKSVNDLSAAELAQLGAGFSAAPSRSPTFEERTALSTAELQRRKAASDAVYNLQNNKGTVADMDLFNSYNNELDRVAIEVPNKWTAGSTFKVVDLRKIDPQNPRLSIGVIKALAKDEGKSVDQIVREIIADVEARK